MIFSSAHTVTQDRTVSTSTSITHLCPSWHNIVDIQWGGGGGVDLSLKLGSDCHCTAAAEILSRDHQCPSARLWMDRQLDRREFRRQFQVILDSWKIPFKLGSASDNSRRWKSGDSHDIYMRVVLGGGGMLRVRLILCKVPKLFSHYAQPGRSML